MQFGLSRFRSLFRVLYSSHRDPAREETRHYASFSVVGVAVGCQVVWAFGLYYIQLERFRAIDAACSSMEIAFLFCVQGEVVAQNSGS
jgi:hypothetical protein